MGELIARLLNMGQGLTHSAGFLVLCVITAGLTAYTLFYYWRARKAGQILPETAAQMKAETE